jgi:hypothetical protein
MTEDLEHYIIQFSKLKADKGNQWVKSADTKRQAPHKPLLLLSVLDRFAEKIVSDNLSRKLQVVVNSARNDNLA